MKAIDFFGEQERARRATIKLLLRFPIAVLGVLATGNITFLIAFGVFIPFLFPLLAAGLFWELVGALNVIMLAGIALGVVWSWWTLSGGGEAVARLANARELVGRVRLADETRLHNVAEELALAAGMPVARLFILDNEPGVNAFAAGRSQHDAVIVVTRGALGLKRDALQGLIAHTYGRILNGDMRLGMVLLALGSLTFAPLAHMARSLVSLAPLAPTIAAMAVLVAFLAYLAHLSIRAPEQFLWVIAGLLFGLIPLVLIGAVTGAMVRSAARKMQASVNRDRVLAADSTGVRLTRLPQAVAAALEAVREAPKASRLAIPYAYTITPLLFTDGVRWSSFEVNRLATHPPLDDRLARLDPAGRSSGAKTAPTAASLIASIGRPSSDLAEDGRSEAEANLIDPESSALVIRASSESRQSLVCAIVLAMEESPAARIAGMSAFAARRGEDYAREVAALADPATSLSPHSALELVQRLAPDLGRLDSRERGDLLEDLTTIANADRHISAFELSLILLLRNHLRPAPMISMPSSLRSAASHVHAILSLVAQAAGEHAAKSFASGAAGIDFPISQPLPAATLTFDRIARALDTLRNLPPLSKAALLEACARAAESDGQLEVEEFALLRVLASTLDCPVPPLKLPPPAQAWTGNQS